MPRANVLDYRVKFTFDENIKTRKLKRRFGTYSPYGLQLIWRYAAMNGHDDGCLGDMDYEDIEAIAQWEPSAQQENGEFARALIDLGFLHSKEGNISIHDRDDHQSYMVELGEQKRRSHLGVIARGSRHKKTQWCEDEGCSEAPDGRMVPKTETVGSDNSNPGLTHGHEPGIPTGEPPIQSNPNQTNPHHPVDDDAPRKSLKPVPLNEDSDPDRVPWGEHQAIGSLADLHDALQAWGVEQIMHSPKQLAKAQSLIDAGAMPVREWAYAKSMTLQQKPNNFLAYFLKIVDGERKKALAVGDSPAPAQDNKPEYYRRFT